MRNENPARRSRASAAALVAWAILLAPSVVLRAQNEPSQNPPSQDPPSQDPPSQDPPSKSDRARSAHFQQAVDGAVDRGVEYLFEEIHSAAGWAPEHKYAAGHIALQIYALLSNDVSRLHPTVIRGLQELEHGRFEKVYSVSLMIMAWGAVLDQIAEDEDKDGDGGPAPFFVGDAGAASRSRVVGRMRDALAWLLAARVRGEGAWNYEPPPPSATSKTARYDHSNSQFAILALGIAQKHGLTVPKRVWEEIADHFVRYQDSMGDAVASMPVFRESDDAPPSKTRLSTLWERVYRNPEAERLARGWGYTVDALDSAPTFSMTAAGQSSVLLAYLRLATSGGRGRRVQALEKSIRDGYAWLSRYLETSRRPHADPYALYSLEKVGDIGYVEELGGVRWFEAGADVLLSRQGERGCWGLPRSPRARSDTALALLFLGRATSVDSRPRAVLVTGRSSERAEEFTNRYAVFLPSLDGAVPIIRFFRRLRYRPSERLLAQSKELVGVYDRDHLDELVLFFLTLERSPSERVRQHGREVLASLTGITEVDLAQYFEWIREWKEVARFGKEGIRAGVPQLRTRLVQATSTPLRLKMIESLRLLGELEAVEELLQLMASEERELRTAAHAAVIVLSKKNFAFDPAAEAEERTAQLEVWQRWWAEEGRRE